MSTYLFDLPTTGSISYTDFCVDQTTNQAYTRHLANATETRARLRGALKELKRADTSERDWLGIIKILDDYIPQVRSIMNCITHDEIGLKAEPVFSWQSSLSSSSLRPLNSNTRTPLPSLHAEHASSLLLYGFTLCNLARTLVGSLGNYESDRSISQKVREEKDEKLKHAADFLARAAGVFIEVGEKILVEWEVSSTGGQLTGEKRPVEMLKEVNSALVNLALADAQTLFIRKLISPAAYESNIAPGPPLPKSHPQPGLVAKLHLVCSDLYTSARMLAKTSGSNEVTPDLRHYLASESALHAALTKKYLSIEAGEKGVGSEKGGEAVGWMQLAQKELQDIKDGYKSSAGLVGNVGVSDKEKKARNVRKERISKELEAVGVWLKNYKKINDTLHFAPIPSPSDLQSRLPTGIQIVSLKPYTPPKVVFGPGSDEYIRRMEDEKKWTTTAEALSELSVEDNKDTETNDGAGAPLRDGLPPAPKPVEQGNYAGAGEYY